MGFDCIIVGAGSAGAVLANRLSEDSTKSVLLIEAGSDYPAADSLPPDLKYGFSSGPAQAGRHTWGYSAEANEFQPAPMPLPRGKVVGGSSAINGSIFLRGLPEDYDWWAKVGNKEWSFQEVLPFFRKAETDLDYRNDFHGSNGPIPIRRYRPENLLDYQAAFYDASLSKGFPQDPDMNLPESGGVGFWPLNHIDGVRISTAVAYIDPVRYRTNLSIEPNVVARRILIDRGRATGVEVEREGGTSSIDCERVILAAGAIASPKLLMLSGFGPKGLLSRLGIPVIWDLPGVGQNLRDHPLAVLLFEGLGPRLSEHVPVLQVGIRYTSRDSDARNDVQMNPISRAGVRGAALGALADQNILGLGVGLESIASEGTVSLGSTTLLEQPIIKYKYLSAQSDLVRMRCAVRLAVDLSEHSAFNRVIARRIFPSDLQLASDDALDKAILESVTTQHHSAGTCKMGPAADPMAVVDQYCRLHGMSNIFVVDASVMPDVVRANTNATTIMLAERVSDWLK